MNIIVVLILLCSWIFIVYQIWQSNNFNNAVNINLLSFNKEKYITGFNRYSKKTFQCLFSKMKFNEFHINIKSE